MSPRITLVTLCSIIALDRNHMLGSGQFGMVFKGECMNKVVAVKTVAPHADKEYLKSLLNELKILIHIGQHPGIVNFIGAQTGELREGRFTHLIRNTISLQKCSFAL